MALDKTKMGTLVATPIVKWANDAAHIDRMIACLKRVQRILLLCIYLTAFMALHEGLLKFDLQFVFHLLYYPMDR